MKFSFLIFAVVFSFVISNDALGANPEKGSAKTSPQKKEDPAEMRHGWSVLTGPKRTIVGVNDKDSIERGKLVFQMHCVACHGDKGQGDGEMAKAFGIRPANLKAMANQFPNHYLVIQINEGKGDMPKWKDLLTTQQTWDLTNYIQTLNSGK